RSLDCTILCFETTQVYYYSVGWIDCLVSGSALGPSLIMLGEHSLSDELPPTKKADPYAIPRKRKLTVPFAAPSFALNVLVVRAFNALYYLTGVKGAGTRLVDWDQYFYPLDAILGWNRIYGRNGFAQFQCALPLANSRD